MTAIPVLGHLFAIYYYTTKKKDKGNQAILITTRTTLIVLSPFMTFDLMAEILYMHHPPKYATGLVAIVFGILYDAFVVLIYKLWKKRSTRFGTLVVLDNIKDIGVWCDTIFNLVLDFVVGWWIPI